MESSERILLLVCLRFFFLGLLLPLSLLLAVEGVYPEEVEPFLEESVVSLENVLQVSQQNRPEEIGADLMMSQRRKRQNVFEAEAGLGATVATSTGDLWPSYTLDGNEVGLELMEEVQMAKEQNSTAKEFLPLASNKLMGEDDVDLLQLLANETEEDEELIPEMKTDAGDGANNTAKVLNTSKANERRTTPVQQQQAISFGLSDDQISQQTIATIATTPETTTKVRRSRRKRIQKKGRKKVRPNIDHAPTSANSTPNTTTTQTAITTFQQQQPLSHSLTATTSTMALPPPLLSPHIPKSSTSASIMQSSSFPPYKANTISMINSTAIVSASSAVSNSTRPTPVLCCPPGGVWANWTAVGQCNDECGACGQRQFRRECLSLAWGCACIGESTARRPCALAPCAFPRLACCDERRVKRQTGGGSLLCGTPPDEPTNLTLPNCLCCPPGGIWGNWQAQTECTDSCGSCGTRRYGRQCLSASWGCQCSGPISLELACNQQPCTFPRLSCCGQQKIRSGTNRTAVCGHEKLPTTEAQLPRSCQ